MSISEQEKAIQGAGTLQGFCQGFGNDIHAQIMLEVLFEGLMNAETIFVFGEPKQERDQINHGASGGNNDLNETHDLSWLETALGLGEKNPTDC